MPVAQYVNHNTQERKTATMPTPKRITDMLRWYKDAKKVIPEIPALGQGWNIEYQDANTDWIRFDLRSREGGKANLVIMRQQGKFGG